MVVMAGLWQGGQLAAERPGAPAGGPLWISDSPLEDGRRLLIVIDQSTRHAAVYHVDAAAGTLALRSTRDITWDLMVGDFNAQEPRPATLQKMLQLPAAAPAR
ncbi:MAG: hypothetical protein ACKOCX_04595 [Planctomycetota bacterium]